MGEKPEKAATGGTHGTSPAGRQPASLVPNRTGKSRIRRLQRNGHAV
jgi:hypothetical protein